MKFLKVDWNFLFRCVFRTQGGLHDAAIWTGLNLPVDIRLARKELTENGPIMYALNTDDQLKIKLPLIISGSAIIQGKKWWFLLHFVWLLDSNTNTTAPCFYSHLIVANFGEFLCEIDNVTCQVPVLWLTKWFINMQHTYTDHKLRK